MTEHTRTVKVTRLIVGHLTKDRTWVGADPLALALRTKVGRGRHLSGGSLAVELTGQERAVLRDMAVVQLAAAADRVMNPPSWQDARESAALGEANACRALLRQLDKVDASEAMLDRLCQRAT